MRFSACIQHRGSRERHFQTDQHSEPTVESAGFNQRNIIILLGASLSSDSDHCNIVIMKFRSEKTTWDRHPLLGPPGANKQERTVTMANLSSDQWIELA